ncbi:MAG: hypothetical protein LC794_17385 [Acidobacteria bacterium]|nr:hypothetical protein [Acidobacteriota bacterium]
MKLISGGGEPVECAALRAIYVDGSHAGWIFVGGFEARHRKLDHIVVAANMFFSDSDVIVGVVGFANQGEVSAVDTYKLVVEDDAVFCDVAGSSAAVAFSDCVGGHWVQVLHS